VGIEDPKVVSQAKDVNLVLEQTLYRLLEAGLKLTDAHGPYFPSAALVQQQFRKDVRLAATAAAPCALVSASFKEGKKDGRDIRMRG